MLLARFGARYAEAKAQRAGLDFEDLELGVRDLLAADPEDRQRWAERFDADHGRRVPGHQPAPARRARGARARQPVRGRRRVPVDLRLPPRRRDDLPRAPRRARRGPRAAADGELPLARGAARRPQRRLRAAVARALRPAAGGQREGARRRRRAAAVRPGRPGRRRAERRAARHRLARAGTSDTRLGLAGVETKPHRRAEARRARPPPARGGRRRPAGARHRRAGARDGLAARARGGARGAGRARPTWSAAAATGPSSRSATASPTSPRSPTRSTRRRCSASSPRRSAASAPTPWSCSPTPAARAAAAIWAALRAAAATPLAGRARRCRRTRARLRAFARFFADERAHAERLPVEVLLERGLEGTGYDLAVLARAERRAAAREPPQADAPGARVRARGGARPARLPRLRRDARLRRGARGRGAARVRGARRGAADDDPPRQGARVPGRLRRRPRPPGRGPARPPADRPPTGEIGLRLATPGGGETVPALAYEQLADAAAIEEDAEERRLFYVAMTRARDRLILSGSTNPERLAAPRPGGPPLDWIAPALLGGALDPARARAGRDRRLGRAPDARARRGSSPRPRSRPARCLAEPRRRLGTPGTALPARAKVVPSPADRAAGARAALVLRPRPVRALRLPLLPPARRCACPTRPPPARGPATMPAAEPPGPALDPRVRGTLAHLLLEELDFARPAAPDPAAVAAAGREAGVELTPEEVADIRGLVEAFGASPLCARLAAARDVRREAGFAFRARPGRRRARQRLRRRARARGRRRRC